MQKEKIWVTPIRGKNLFRVNTNGKKKQTSELREVTIININKALDLYMILIDDDVSGWSISEFYIKYLKLPKEYKGKRFHEVPSYAFVCEQPKSENDEVASIA